VTIIFVNKKINVILIFFIVFEELFYTHLCFQDINTVPNPFFMKTLKITKLITKKEDASLGRYLYDIRKESLLTTEEEDTLARKIKDGDAIAFEKLIRSNLRFVVSVAKKYQHQGLPLSDLINEGNLGLINAAERYNVTKGFKFISYAVWWIRQSIIQAIAEQSRIVRLPMNKVWSITSISKTFAKLEQDYQREPVAEEIAESLDLKEQVVRENLEISNFPISADAPLREIEEDSITLYDILINHDSPSPDIQLIDHSQKIIIERTLGKLPGREAEILRLYFGLNGECPLTVNEIAYRLGITTQAVILSKKKALKKLKKICENKEFRSFFG
jgi:RNA polymerase primary sigma factor